MSSQTKSIETGINYSEAFGLDQEEFLEQSLSIGLKSALDAVYASYSLPSTSFVEEEDQINCLLKIYESSIRTIVSDHALKMIDAKETLKIPGE